MSTEEHGTIKKTNLVYWNLDVNYEIGKMVKEVTEYGKGKIVT